jgi:peptide/nickel transport system permease protein
MNVVAYVVRRILVAVFLLIGLTFLTFWLYDLTPIDPARVVIGGDPGRPLPQAQIDFVNHALGVDRPLTTQYADWAKHVLHGDLGLAWQGMTIDPDNGLFGTSVTQSIVPAVWHSVSVVVGGLALLLLIVIPIAAFSAARPSSWFDRITAALLLIGISTHPLVVALILQTMQRRWTWIPWGGYCPIHKPEFATEPLFGAAVQGEPCYGVGNWAAHLLLPWLTFSVFFAALYVRVLRTTLLEVLDEPYVATARAKGASEPRVMLRHALRNAMRPILTMTAMEAGMAVSVLLYIEVVYGIGGLGRLSLTAFSGEVGYDRPMIAAIVLVIGIAIIGLNLIVDLLYPVIDPRVVVGQDRQRLVVGPAA